MSKLIQKLAVAMAVGLCLVVSGSFAHEAKGSCCAASAAKTCCEKTAAGDKQECCAKHAAGQRQECCAAAQAKAASCCVPGAACCASGAPTTVDRARLSQKMQDLLTRVDELRKKQ